MVYLNQKSIEARCPRWAGRNLRATRYQRSRHISGASATSRRPTSTDHLAGCGKSNLFCYSERSEESLFELSSIKQREILRFAQNDKMTEGLFPQPARS